MKNNVLFCLIFFYILFLGNSIAKEALIVTSIAPSQSLVAMITEGTKDPAIIINNNTDPHHMELTFKQISLIKNSKIIFIISVSCRLRHY
jgi:ABC-type Zn uptake system ZnuABC Zn-binding protein ZnuA